MTEPHPYLFVYGTLRNDAGFAMGRLLASAADFIDAAFFQGRLFLVDHYPGVVPSADPGDIVHGDVFRLHHPEQMLARLDHYEQCGEAFAAPTEFIRVLGKIRFRDGQMIDAWIYLYNRPIDSLTRITSGDFRGQHVHFAEKE